MMPNLSKIESTFRKLTKVLGAVFRNVALLIIAIFATYATAVSASIVLSMQDAPLSIARDLAATKNLIGIPKFVPGKIHFYFKWHAIALLPTYNKLKIELLHGTSVMRATECYSIHSSSYKTPKCEFDFVITADEAKKDLAWKIRVTNNSSNDVNGFNIRKEITDLNPFVPDIKTSFEPDCTAVKLFLASPNLTVSPNSSVETKMHIPSGSGGSISFRAKWHIPDIEPIPLLPSYRMLRISLTDENRSSVLFTSCFSFHSPETPKCDFKVNVGSYGGIREWKVTITNDTGFEARGFNIEKGGDLNPLVPSFISTFKPTCN